MTPSRLPTVSIVGRPNVGKSTLFNRLVGKRRAIVHDQPGVTRDRISEVVELGGRTFQLVDTGGLVPEGEDALGLGAQVLFAVEESDVLVFVVDGKAGLLGGDEEVWERLRRYGKPAVLVVNKGDTREAEARFDEFWRLGVGEQVLVSAEHALGIADLVESLARLLAEAVPEVPEGGEASGPEAPAIAIVGRPNVGKSSLVNKILGRERALVSPEAGTTRDPVDTLVRREEGDYLLVDTAGIRRRAKTSGAPEELAVMFARRQIDRARLAVLVIDAAQGVTSGDLSIAGVIWETGRAAVVAVNKWDLLDPESREALEEGWPRLDEILSEPPRVNVSALTGRGVDKLFPAIDRTLEAFSTELPTSEVNRIFEKAVERRRPPAHQGRPWKLYYATQVGTAPPTFMLFANRTLARSDSYRRYLENRLREALDLPGVPVRLVVRKR